MFSKLIAIVLFGLGIMHPAGNVAGLADIRATTTATRSPELETARQRGLTASTSAYRNFQSQLSTIRDTRKKAMVEKLNLTLNDVNTKRANSLLTMLNRLSDIIAKVQSRAASLKTSGKDISSVDAAVGRAQTAIAAAKAAILAQAGKQYTATISSELNLKTDMGKTMSGLQSDLSSVRDLVIAAQKTVSDAVRTMGELTGETLSKTATGSGAQK